jgi:hypothetical protein
MKNAPKGQLTMFDLTVDTIEVPRTLTPGCLLPVQQPQLVNVPRVAKILSVTTQTVRVLIDRKLLPAFRVEEKQNWSVPYDSVVDFCNQLRMDYMIRDRRPKLAPGMRRWRDEDLLPFPWSDTITVSEAATGFNTRPETILHLINDRAKGEVGVFDAYHFMEVSPWRISRSSLLKYAQKLRNDLEAQQGKR